MSFLAPMWLWLLGFFALYLYAAKTLHVRERKTLLMALSILFGIIALSRPALPQAPATLTQEGRDIIIAIDLSYSMQASDLAPTRLAYAKTLLRDLIGANTKDRFAIIGFTTSAIILSPLSDDRELLLHLFEGLDESLILTKGSSIMSALELSRRISSAPNPAVLLLSDGGDEERYEKEAAFAKAGGLHVSVALLAGEAGSSITQRDGSLLKDEHGDIVISRANNAVRAIAESTGGSFLMRPSSAELTIWLGSLEGSDFAQEKEVAQHFELFGFLVALSLLCALLAFTTLGVRVHVMLLALFLGANAEAGVLDFIRLHLAQSAYTQERFEDAARHFGAVDSAQARFNAASALYKAGKYEEALTLLRSLKSADAHFKALIFYTMGNCLIRLQEFKEAREMFMKSLTLKEDSQAKENLLAIMETQEQDHMITGRQKGKERAQSQSEESSQKGPRKEGGSSNMEVDAAGSADSDGGKEVQGEERLSFGQSKSKLSSRQYELINQRSVNETKPW
ncbi:MAG: VWA domain-containing protein [Campylobacterales bacterium]|nr:VWA domain-containing protein [Campylobacterales bacterium]